LVALLTGDDAAVPNSQTQQIRKTLTASLLTNNHNIMTIDNLDLKEKEIYKKVVELNTRKSTNDLKDEFEKIHESYRQIHRQYAEFASNDIESLKRGLFIQWFAMVEPIFLSGISNLDSESEIKIIAVLNELLENKTLDEEMKFMLTHYTHSNWDWVLKRFENYDGIKKFIEQRQDNDIPERIDSREMENRGRMGLYWKSFSKNILTTDRKASS